MLKIFERITFLTLVAGFLTLLIWVNLTTAPAVLFDEYIYATAAKFDPASISTGGFLYSFTYSLGGMLPGENIYEFGRLINVLFTVVTGLGLFAIARTYLDTKRAAWVALGVSLFSISVWTHLFMPEAMYIAFVTWAFVFLLWSSSARSSRTAFFLLSISLVLFSLSALVKVHTLFILPAIIFAIYLALTGIGETKLKRSIAALLLGLAIVPLKLFFGFLLAGERGLSLLGEYQSAVDALFTRLAEGESIETNQGLAPAGGFYIGFEDRFVDIPAPSVLEILGMVVDRAFTFLPIALIAFGWIVLAAMTLREKGEGKQVRFLPIVGVLGINLFALAVVFNVFASVGGDDHSNRVLFRYVEYVFLFGSVLGAALLLVGEYRNPKHWLVRARPYLVVFVFLVALVGPQARVTANYADSAFIPVMGNLWIWLPIVIVSFIAVFLVTEMYSQRARSVLTGLVLGSYGIAGVLSQFDFQTSASRQALTGIETAHYVANSETRNYFQIVKLPQTAGRVATLGSLQEVRYGIALGTNAVKSSDLPIAENNFLAIDQVFFELDDPGLSFVDSGKEFEILKRSDRGKLRDTIPVSQTLRDADFEFYSSGAVYSEDGNAEITVEQEITQSSTLEICLLLPEDIKDRRVVIGVQDFESALQLGSDSYRVPQCFELGFGSDVKTDKIRLTAPVLTNELDSGEVISTVSFGVSKIEVRG